MSGLSAGIAAAAVASLVVYIYERRAGRDALLVRLSLLFVAVQSAVGLASHSTTVYLAQPVLANAAWGVAFLVSARFGRPLAGVLACAWYPFPRWVRQTDRLLLLTAWPIRYAIRGMAEEDDEAHRPAA